MERRRTIGLAATLILGVPASAGGSVHRQPFTYDRSHRTGTDLMREILVADATMDGSRVTGFRRDDRCRTTIATGRQSTTIDWSTVTNIISRGRMPPGDAALQRESGFGLLANVCGA